jgi:hypothetical protein
MADVYEYDEGLFDDVITVVGQSGKEDEVGDDCGGAGKTGKKSFSGKLGGKWQKIGRLISRI